MARQKPMIGEDPKKAAERRHVAAFFAARPDLALEDLVPNEAPDFLGRWGARRVGLEVTRLPVPSRPSMPVAEEQDSLRQRVVEAARAQHQAAGGLPLHVQVIFSHHGGLTKRRVPDLAARLAHWLVSESRSLAPWERVPFDYARHWKALPEIAALGAIRVPAEDYGHWYPARGGYMRPADEAEIASVVRAKEARLPSYAARCDETWLLIVLQVIGNDVVVELPAQPVVFTLSSSFSRIFCLDLFGGPRSVEIPVTP